MTVKVEEPPLKGDGKPLYIDIGVVNLATVWVEGLKQPIAFSGRTVLADWWYWTGRISREQRRLARINGTKTSKKLRKLYRIRQRRFRHAVNAMVNNFWSFDYIVRRFKEKAEEYGIKVEEKSEYKTSSKCPFCHSENIKTNGRLLNAYTVGWKRIGMR